MSDDNSYESKQKRLKRDMEQVTKFREKHPKHIETFFKDAEHVGEIAIILKCSVGQLNKDWFIHLPRGMNTGDILAHNAEAETEDDKIRQYMYIGLPDYMSEADIEELLYEIDMLKLKNLSA